jgi:hypothetical protein
VPENDDRVNSKTHFNAAMERVWKCTGSSRLRELRDALGGCDRASLEIHLHAEVE